MTHRLDGPAERIQGAQAPLRCTIAADPEGWLERQAIAADGAPGWLPAELAAGLRRAQGMRPAPRPADRTETEQEPWDRFSIDQQPAPAAPAVPPRLGSSREVISTSSRPGDVTACDHNGLRDGQKTSTRSGRLLDDPDEIRRLQRAAVKVDLAHVLLSQQLRRRAVAARGAWDLPRARALDTRADCVERRRQQTELCVSGRNFVGVYVCESCSTRQAGVPLTCNSRVCPRCCALIRDRATAHLHDLFSLIDQRRARKHQAPPRWRFVTLTVPSTPSFLPQKLWLSRSWGRLLRRDLWRDRVRAAVASWETTHTRKGWHVHVHAVVDAFLHRPKLVREWQDACLRELLADAAPDSRRPDAKKRRRIGIWRAAPLLPETVRCAQKLLRIGRRVPAVLEGKGFRVDLDGVGHLDSDVELQHLQGGGVVLTWSRAVVDDDGVPVLTRRPWSDVTADVDVDQRPAVRAQLDQLLAMLPTGAGVFIKDTTGDRASLVRELAKYLAKDLGGASTDVDAEGSEASEWGVAGTVPRLAEFLDGSFRWRALRTYGDAYHAGEELQALHDGQCCCDCGGSLAWEQVACVEPGEQVRLPRCGHQSQRFATTPRSPPARTAVPAARATAPAACHPPP